MKSWRAGLAEFQKDFPEDWQRERRMEYLKEELAGLIVTIWQQMDRHGDFVRRNRLLEMILTRETIDGLTEQALKTLTEIHVLRDAAKGKVRPDEITPDMIQRAREYPFARLYEFKRNMARCPFHDDKTPSFALMKDNTARCFGACGKSWDTIAFVREKEGLSFPEAVRWLQ